MSKRTDLVTVAQMEDSAKAIIDVILNTNTLKSIKDTLGVSSPACVSNAVFEAVRELLPCQKIDSLYLYNKTCALVFDDWANMHLEDLAKGGNGNDPDLD
jgi:hypothetical protein